VFSNLLPENDSFAAIRCNGNWFLLIFVATDTWLPRRCSAMDVCSGYTIPAFSCHVIHNMLQIVPTSRVVELYLRSPICFHDIMFRYVIKYRGKFTVTFTHNLSKQKYPCIMLLLRDCSLCGSYKNIVTDLLKPFLGNGSVNTFQRATMEDVSQWTNVIARC
jgi:hypothetical protein